MRKTIIGILLLGCLLPFLTLACKGGGNGPASPSGGGPSFTPTPSFTPSPTPTLTPTPDCVTVPDISVQINDLVSGGITDISGNDAAGTPGLYLDGLGSTGNIFSFHVSSAVTLTFSLCPTQNPPDSYRDMILALRSGACGATVDAAFNDDSCDYLPEIQGFVAVPGTTYFVVPMDYGPGAPYDLRILSGPVPGAVCTETPVSTPLALSPGQYPNCGTAYSLGSLGTGDSVATGQLDDAVNTDDYYSFMAANSGTVTVTLDCFDNGLGQADFDIYSYNSCPATTGSVVKSSTGQVPVEQFTFQATPGTTYYLDANAYFGGGPYRLTVQTP